MIARSSIIRTLAWPFIVALVFTLASCATGALKVGGGRTTQSAYGNYLAARFASGINDVQAAAEYYAAALKKEPQNSLLRQQAFLSALMAGNISQSASFARPELGTKGEAYQMRLSVAATQIRKKHYTEAQNTLSVGKYGPFNREVRQLLQGWVSYGTGDPAKALAQIKSVDKAPLFTRISQLNTALLLDLSGDTIEAEKAYKAATAPFQLSDRAAYAYGAFLENQGRDDEARAIYENAIKVFVAAPMTSAALARLDAGNTRYAPKLVRNASEGAAEALYGTAQILATQAHFDKALVYLEMARYINPNHNAAEQLLGRLMAAEKRPDDALNMLSGIPENSPYRLRADLNRARLLFSLDRRDEALDIFQALATAHPDDNRLLGAYADALRSMQKFDLALPIYERLIARQGEKAGWQIYFARGTVLERLGRWRDSVVDFRKALTLSPNQPDVLNYLGYTFVDAGENLDEGFALIEKALSLRPQAGYIIDSLGWAHYRMGDYEQAVRYLERAVEMEPGEPTISDHLADAYWQAGRHLEARFQWSHTLSLKPDDDIDLDKVKEKLVHGLRDAPEIANAKP